jgi:hypothetical protein
VPVKIYRPGYFRFYLPQEASLDDYPFSLRLVFQGEAIPYFLGETRPTEVPIEWKTGTDASGQGSVWELTLPQASSRWSWCRLKVSGDQGGPVRVMTQAGKPLPVAPEWTRSGPGASAVLEFSLEGLPDGETRLRVEAEPGSGQLPGLIRADAVYPALTVIFLASKAGDHELYGGDPSGPAPSYDTAWFVNRLSEVEPETIQPGQLKTVQTRRTWRGFLRAVFRSGWFWAAIAIPLAGGVALAVVRMKRQGKGGD